MWEGESLDMHAPGLTHAACIPSHPFSQGYAGGMSPFPCNVYLAPWH